MLVVRGACCSHGSVTRHLCAFDRPQGGGYKEKPDGGFLFGRKTVLFVGAIDSIDQAVRMNRATCKRAGAFVFVVAAGVSPAVRCCLQPTPAAAGKLRLPLQKKSWLFYSCSLRIFF
jgi:hypothetical protein